MYPEAELKVVGGHEAELQISPVDNIPRGNCFNGSFLSKDKAKEKIWGVDLRKNENNQLKATEQSFYKTLSNVNYMYRPQKWKRERKMNAIYIPRPYDNE